MTSPRGDPTLLAPGRQHAPDDRPEVRWTEHADAPGALALSEVGGEGAWIRIEEPVVAPDLPP